MSLLTTPGEEKARNGNLHGAVIDYVVGYDWVTLIELRRFLAPYMVTEGDTYLCASNDSNLILWPDVSTEFADLITGLLAEGMVLCAPSSRLAYLMDGGALRLPLAKKPPKSGYRSPRWLPVCLRAAKRSAA